MKLSKIEKKMRPIIAIALSFASYKDKGMATILLVGASGVLTYLLTMYWPRNR